MMWVHLNLYRICLTVSGSCVASVPRPYPLRVIVRVLIWGGKQNAQNYARAKGKAWEPRPDPVHVHVGLLAPFVLAIISTYSD